MSMSTNEKSVAEAEIAAKVLVALIETTTAFRSGNATTDAAAVAAAFKTIHAQVKASVGA